jgi:hypothetical protein
MRERKIFAGAAALLLGGLLMCVVRRGSNGGLPPVVSVLGIEPANIMDDAGAEMWLVTLSISNSVTWPNEPVFVKDSDIPVEAKVASRWVGVEGQIGLCALSHFQPHRIDVVVPANAGACRITFKWTRARLTSGRLRWIAENSGGWLPSEVRNQLWRHAWGGFPSYRPSSHWREVCVELPVLLRAASMVNSIGAHNDGSAADAGFSLSVFQDHQPGPADVFR